MAMNGGVTITEVHCRDDGEPANYSLDLRDQ